MASYSLLIKPSAAKEIEAVPRKDRLRIVNRIYGLADDPHPPGSEKLTGQEKYRIRQGNYRILYTIKDADLIVTVVSVGDRKNVFRK